MHWTEHHQGLAALACGTFQHVVQVAGWKPFPQALYQRLYVHWLVEITRCGPTAIRDKELAERSIRCLESHRWLVTADSTATVRGVKPHKAWRIVTDDK